MLSLDLSAPRTLKAANAHFYKLPTEERYIDRVLEYHDLIFLEEGSWSMTELEQDYPLVQGDVLFLASGRHHFSRLPCEKGTRTFCLHVTVAPGDTEDNPNAATLPTHLHVRHPEKIRQYFSEIVTVFWSEAPYKEQRLQSLLNLLLFALYDEHRQQAVTAESLADRAIRRMNDAPHTRFETKEMAALLFVSPKTLNNAMHERTGLPFYAYEKNHKLEMAASLLRMEPEMKLSEIAAAFGFHDESHLSKAFKQKYGISPSDYRSKSN